MVWVIGFAELGSDKNFRMLRKGHCGRSSVAFSSPDSLVICSISLCDQNYFHLSKFRYRDYSCCRDKVNRAAGRRTVVMVFASPSGQLYRDTEILPTYRDFAKTHANPDTDGNSPYHRAVSVHL